MLVLENQELEKQLTALEEYSRQQLKYTRLQCLFSLISLVCCVIVVVLVFTALTRVEAMVTQAEDILGNLEVTTRELAGMDVAVRFPIHMIFPLLELKVDREVDGRDFGKGNRPHEALIQKQVAPLLAAFARTDIFLGSVKLEIEAARRRVHRHLLRFVEERVIPVFICGLFPDVFVVFVVEGIDVAVLGDEPGNRPASFPIRQIDVAGPPIVRDPAIVLAGSGSGRDAETVLERVVEKQLVGCLFLRGLARRNLLDGRGDITPGGRRAREKQER